jgi:hypothetical protein
LQSRERKLDRQWVRLLDAFQDGLLDKTELSERKQRVEQERQTIAERIAKIQRQERQQSVKAKIIDEFSAFCADAQKALENPTPEAKQEVLRLLVEQIIVEDDAITIKHIIPTDESCRLLPRHNNPERLYSSGNCSSRVLHRQFLKAGFFNCLFYYATAPRAKFGLRNFGLSHQ